MGVLFTRTAGHGVKDDTVNHPHFRSFFFEAPHGVVQTNTSTLCKSVLLSLCLSLSDIKCFVCLNFNDYSYPSLCALEWARSFCQLAEKVK